MTEQPSSEKYSYTLTRDLDATAEEVFAAWTTPARYEQWAGAAADTVEMDVRPGGAWKAEMVTPDGQRFPLSGRYLEVVPATRLVVGMDVPGKSEPEAMSIDLAEGPGGTTRITLSQSCDTAEERDMSKEGSTMLLDSLTTHLATGE